MNATLAELSLNGASGIRRWIDPTSGMVMRDPSVRDLAHIPGRRGLPWLGVMAEAIRDPMKFAASMVAEHGWVYRFHALGRWHVHLAGPQANELILFDQAGIFSAAQGWGPLIGGLFPGALLIQDGAEHRANRRLLGEAFRQAQLTGYQRIFANDISTAISEWSGRTIDIYREVKRLTFRVSATTFLGLPLEDRATEAISAFSRMMAGLLTIVSDPRLSYARARGHRARRRLEALLTALIDEKRLAPGDDFLSRVTQLRDEGRELSTKKIVDSFIFLLTASHDTLASALTSSTYYLAAHRDWAARLRTEALRSGISDSREAATAELPLHDMFFKEVLRLNGPAPVLWRRAVREFDCYGYRIPAGTMTGANLMMTHRLPELWENPLRFDPYRFLPENERKMNRFAYAPFSGGVHKCLGLHFSVQQARIFMVELLRRCDLELKNEEPVQWYHWPNCRPRYPLPIAVHPRCRET